MPNRLSGLLRCGVLHIRANERALLPSPIRPSQVNDLRAPPLHPQRVGEPAAKVKGLSSDSVSLPVSRSSCPSSPSGPWSALIARGRSPPPAPSPASSPPSHLAGTPRLIQAHYACMLPNTVTAFARTGTGRSRRPAVVPVDIRLRARERERASERERVRSEARMCARERAHARARSTCTRGRAHKKDSADKDRVYVRERVHARARFCSFVFACVCVCAH